MKRVAIDVLGPLLETDQGNKYIFIAMDYFSKWPETYALRNQEAVTVADVLVSSSLVGLVYLLSFTLTKVESFSSWCSKRYAPCLGSVRLGRLGRLPTMLMFGRALRVSLNPLIGRPQGEPVD